MIDYIFKIYNFCKAEDFSLFKILKSQLQILYFIENFFDWKHPSLFDGTTYTKRAEGIIIRFYLSVFDCVSNSKLFFFLYFCSHFVALQILFMLKISLISVSFLVLKVFLYFCLLVYLYFFLSTF